MTLAMDIATLAAGLYLAAVAVLTNSGSLREELILRLPIGLIGTVMIARAGSALGLF